MASTFFYFIVIISCVNACIKMVPPDMEEMPVTDTPVTNMHGTDEPVTSEPVTSEPVTNEPVTDEPVTNEPVTDEPVTDEPVTDEPVTDEPVTDEPVTDGPVTNEPITEEPATNEPITDEPVTDAPAGCTLCKIESLFNPADLTLNGFYHPPDSNIIPTPDPDSDCISYNILCASDGSAFTWTKDENGGPKIDFVSSFSPLTCGDDGIFSFRGQKITAFFCQSMFGR